MHVPVCMRARACVGVWVWVCVGVRALACWSVLRFCLLTFIAPLWQDEPSLDDVSLAKQLKHLSPVLPDADTVSL